MIVSDKEVENIIARMESMLDLLMEHGAVCVRLLVTADQQKSGTVTLESGRGNILTQKGMVRDWLLKQDEYIKKAARDD